MIEGKPRNVTRFDQFTLIEYGKGGPEFDAETTTLPVHVEKDLGGGLVVLRWSHEDGCSLYLWFKPAGIILAAVHNDADNQLMLLPYMEDMILRVDQDVRDLRAVWEKKRMDDMRRERGQLGEWFQMPYRESGDVVLSNGMTDIVVRSESHVDGQAAADALSVMHHTSSIAKSLRSFANNYCDAMLILGYFPGIVFC